MDRAPIPPTREPVVPDSRRGNDIVGNARREFTSVFGDLARGKRNWQVAAFALAGAVALEAVAIIGLARAARVVPYVVRVDQLGRVDAVGQASPMRDPDAALIASQLADFIRSVRTVLPPAAASAQAALLRRGYAFVTPDAAGFLNSYLGDPAHDPRVLGMRLTREVEVTSLLRVPDASTGRRRGGEHAQTWRLQWTETDRPTQLGDSTANHCVGGLSHAPCHAADDRRISAAEPPWALHNVDRLDAGWPPATDGTQRRSLPMMIPAHFRLAFTVTAGAVSAWALPRATPAQMTPRADQLPVTDSASATVARGRRPSVASPCDSLAGTTRRESISEGALSDDDVTTATCDFLATGVARVVRSGSFVTFPYGHSQPTVTCARLRACVIELEPGEVVLSRIAGDLTRWEITPAPAGPDGRTTLVVVKPKDCDLTTNVVLATDRRIYDLTLDSPPCRRAAGRSATNPQDPYARHVRFYYPDQTVVQWSRPAPPRIAADVAELNFNYDVRRDKRFPWRPAQVFDDGAHVYIKLPEAARHDEAPALFVVAGDGSRTLVNYTVIGDTYVTDRLFNRAVLVAGVDGKERKVVIERRAAS